MNHSVKRRRQAFRQTHHHYYLNISVEAANLSDWRIESNRKNGFGSENRIESNRNFFARIGMLYSCNAIFIDFHQGPPRTIYGKGLVGHCTSGHSLNPPLCVPVTFSRYFDSGYKFTVPTRELGILLQRCTCPQVFFPESRVSAAVA